MGEFQSHNGTDLGKQEEYKTASEIEKTMKYQTVNIGQYFIANFGNFLKLFEFFKAKDENLTHLYIFCEVMLKKSPFQINYPDDLKDKIYIFQIDTSSGVSYRIDQALSKDLEALGLSPVPFLESGVFGFDFFQSLCTKLKELQREGAVVSMPNDKLAWKFKHGGFDTSTYASKFNEDHENGPSGDIVKLIQDLAKQKAPEKQVETKAKGGNKGKQVNEAEVKAENTIKTLMVKECGHHDWKGDFEAMNKQMESLGKNEKKKVQNEFFKKFSDIIVEKIKVEDPDLLNTCKYELLIMKNINPILRG